MGTREQKTILLVEDDTLIAMAEAETIRRFGYRVITANSGEKAVHLAIENKDISLILMDIDLGKGIDGPEAARNILSTRMIPIVFLTSHSEREYVERVREITRYGYVIKDSGDFVLQSSIEMAFELYGAHEKTRVSETKYRRLHETMTDAFVLVDMKGNIREVNQSFVNMLGYSMEELLRLTYLDLTPEKWLSFESRIVDEQIMVRGFSEVYEKEYIRKNNTVFPVELRTFLIKDNEGSPLGLWAIVRDITERKQAEAQLYDREEMMRYIVQHDPNAIAVYDHNLNYIAVSKRYLQDYDVRETDILGKHHYEVFPEMPQKWKDVHQRCLAGAIEYNDDDYFERPDGSITCNRWECRPWYHGDGQIGGIITYTEVITERKKAEKVLKESEERFRAIFESHPDPIVVWDRDYNYLYANQTAIDHVGTTPDKVIGKNIRDGLGHIPDFMRLWMSRVDHVFESGKVMRVEDAMTVGEHLEYSESVLSPISDAQGNIVAVGVVYHDITARKLAEKTLKESEGRLRDILFSMAGWVWEVDENGIYTYASHKSLDLLGWSMEEVVGKTPFDFMPPDEAERVRAIFSEIVANKAPIKDLENWNIRRNGDRICLLANGVPILDEAGNLKGYRGVDNDITERRQAELELISTKARVDSLLASAPVMIYSCKTTGDFGATFISENVKDYLGYQAREIITTPGFWANRIHPEDIPRVFANLPLVFEKGHHTHEYRFQHKNGEYRWMHDRLTLVRDKSGEPVEIIGSWLDITDRRQAETALQESESFLNTLLSSIPIPVFYKGKDGRYLGFNRAFEIFFGITKDQLIGKTVFDISPPELAEIYHTRDTELFESGGIQCYESQVQSALGPKRDVIFNKAVFTNVQGVISGQIGAILDITERKLAEDRIKTLLSEKELLLREVHHRIKNNMNVIGSLLSLQSSLLEGSPAAVTALHDARSRVLSMMVLYDKLYRSADFRKISTKEYLASLIDEIVDTFPNRRLVSVEKQIDDFILDAKALSPLGIILNELLTNTMKHAFTGRDHGTVAVFFSVKDNHGTLTVQDNGIGIPDSIDVGASAGFGLQLVGMLAEQLKGNIRIERQNGSKFVLEFDV